MKFLARNLLTAALALSLLSTGVVLAEGQTGQGPGPGNCCPTCGKAQRPQRHHGKHARAAKNPMARMMRQLNLTDAQRQKIEPIMKEFRQQGQARFQAHRASFESVLTAEQKAQLEKNKADRGRGPRGLGLQQLDLSQDQKTRLATLREQAQNQRKADMQNLKARLATVLTAEQKAQLDQVFQDRPNRQAGPRRGPGQRGPCPQGPQQGSCPQGPQGTDR